MASFGMCLVRLLHDILLRHLIFGSSYETTLGARLDEATRLSGT